LKQYPRDRVVLNDLGRVLFLQRKFADAVKALNSVLEIDPEDLQAHYNLMLCYNGLGDEKDARDHQVRYLRFKADEASQTITGPYRQAHPDDNNERQAIHEHVSVPLGQLRAASASIGRGATAHVATGTPAKPALSDRAGRGNRMGRSERSSAASKSSSTQSSGAMN